MLVLRVEHQCQETKVGNNAGGGGGGAGYGGGDGGGSHTNNQGGGGGQGIAIPSTFRDPANPYGRAGRPGQSTITGGFTLLVAEEEQVVLLHQLT